MLENTAIALVGLVAILYASYQRKHRKPQIPDSSVLLAFYTDGTQLEKLHSGQIGDMNYTAIMASSNLSLDGSSSNPALIYQIELPFKTNIHLVGIPKLTGVTQLDPAGRNSLMEPVVLEGDYRNYFTLYAEKGMQMQARYVLDPKAMLFTMDFCRSHNWEILKDTLYFVQTGGQAKDDNTPMFDDIEKFVNEIQPALSVPLSPLEEQQRTPYGQDRRTDLTCPVCQTVMLRDNSLYRCPNAHGVLLMANQLAAYKSGELASESAQTITPQVNKSAHGALLCPSCGTVMTPVPYNGSTTTIDSCTKCPYRWLDGKELLKE